MERKNRCENDSTGRSIENNVRCKYTPPTYIKPVVKDPSNDTYLDNPLAFVGGTDTCLFHEDESEPNEDESEPNEDESDPNEDESDPNNFSDINDKKDYWTISGIRNENRYY